MNRKKWSIIVFLLGFLILIFPIFAKTITNQEDKSIVSDYEESLNNISKEAEGRLMEAYSYYNRTLSWEEDILDPFDDRGNVINTNADSNNNNRPKTGREDNDLAGIIATIEIPKLRLQLPIFQGATDENLRKGIGQITGTSLPLGEKDSHSVLAGHRGFARRQLFSKIDRLTIGDTFIVTSLAGKLEYKVVETIIIEPNETDYLMIEKGKDKVTLLTCTPLGDKRFLVIGERKL